MPKELEEDVDKIIEEFISSVEETDISSFDGERSDTSSIFGGAVKPMLQYGDTESFKSPQRSNLLPGEMDGVVLPWLKWETGNDGTPHLVNDNKQHPITPKTVLHGTQEVMYCSILTPDSLLHHALLILSMSMMNHFHVNIAYFQFCVTDECLSDLAQFQMKSAYLQHHQKLFLLCFSVKIQIYACGRRTWIVDRLMFPYHHSNCSLPKK